MTIEVVPVTDAQGVVTNAALLSAAEAVHRQLRPQLPPDYVERMKQIFAGGAEMAVALIEGRVAGITVYRVLEKTMSGRELHCDDLITDENLRSGGVGNALIAYLQGIVAARTCDTFTLNSGTQREKAHRFYFREGMTITAFHFSKKVAAKPAATPGAPTA